MITFLQCSMCKHGATAIEYALIAGLISMAAVAAFSTIGTDLSSTFNTVAASF
jgi:pilus assembly protein Flp/PilA